MGPVPVYDEFTEDGYLELLRLAKERYRFVFFGEYRSAEPGSILWRHDVDLSVHRALALARIEADEGVLSTWFVNPHSPNYNLLEDEIARLVEQILSLGHELGLHFEPGFHASRERSVEEGLASEKALLEDVFETEIAAFSLHTPEIAGWNAAADKVAGMVNAYGRYLRQHWGYCSDSMGIWRHRRLRDVLEAGEDERLHVLTHPEWWVPEPQSPRARVARAIEGRAARQHDRYDRLVEEMGRENVGRDELELPTRP